MYIKRAADLYDGEDVRDVIVASDELIASAGYLADRISVNLEAYEAYQVAHENENLQKGAAFQLIKAFLELNNTEFGRLVEVIIMSRNNANTCLRIFNSIQ